MAELSVILPCYNEAGNLDEILARYRVLAGAINLELVLVDNGSTDDTGRILDEALRNPVNSFVRRVSVPANIGYGHGIQAGLQASQGTILAFSHADLQCNPEDFVEALMLYRRCEPSGVCLIKGRRQGSRPLADRAMTWVYNHLAARLLRVRAFYTAPQRGLYRLHAADVNAQPKLFPRELLADLLQGPVDFTFDLFVLTVACRRKMPIVEFMVDYKARRWGRSKLAANPRVRIVTSMKALRYMVNLQFRNTVQVSPPSGGQSL